MRMMTVVTLLVALAATAPAHDLGIQAPHKEPQAYPENFPNPHRQGGDTIETALPIPSLPIADTGTTTGYNDDYDVTCPFDSSSPEVVYRLISSSPQNVDIDLCGSGSTPTTSADSSSPS